MTVATLSVQDALVALLTDATPVGERVYDEPPRDQNAAVPANVFPYIGFGEGQVLPDDAVDVSGAEEFLDLNVWSRPEANTGWVEVKQIVDAIHTAAHGKPLAVAGRSFAHCWVRSTRFLRDRDGVTRRAVVTLRILHHA